VTRASRPRRASLRLTIGEGAPDDAAAIAALRNAAAARLTAIHGAGHWSGMVTARGVLSGMRGARLVVARRSGAVVGTLSLSTRKPWAIDPSYFAPARRPLYLTDMAVHPDVQRRGIGRRLLAAAEAIARAWPADAIRLDAYDAPAGAEGFYAACGYREVGRVTYRGTPLVYHERVL
jgi:GNAT superfamily N-acetyltransferase